MPRIVLPCLLAVTALVLSGCSSPAEDEPVTTTPDPGSSAIRMAAVGDSITEADSEDLNGGDPGPQSWVSYAVDEEVEFVGGWALWGASTAQMAQEVEPLDADVLVILAGTNDATGMAPEQIGTNIAEIADSAEVPRVVLSSIPPMDIAPDSAVELNTYLERFADDQGWVWVDAADELRDGATFADGMADDGLHPNERGAQVLGGAIGAAIRQAAG